jgi:hypothetical protein
MAISQRKQTNIVLTFKVLQFVNQLRRRVRPRTLDGSWPEGDQEHSKWVILDQRAKHEPIASPPPTARLQKTQKQCREILLIIGAPVGGMHCFRSLRHVWRTGATVRP